MIEPVKLPHDLEPVRIAGDRKGTIPPWTKEERKDLFDALCKFKQESKCVK